MKQLELPRTDLPISQDEVRFWKAEIQASLKRQKNEFIARTGYEALIEYFESVQLTNAATLEQMAIMDEFSPAIASRVGTAYYQNPTINVNAKNPTAEEFVRPGFMYLLQHPEFKPFKVTDLFNASLRYGMDKVKMKDEMQLGAFDLIVAGFTAVEMNHLTQKQVADGEEQANGLLDKAKQFASGFIDKVTGKSDVDAEAQATEGVDRVNDIFSDKTYCKRWNPLEVLFDPRAQVFGESRFIAKIIKMSVADFNKQYPKWKGKFTEFSSGELTDMPYNQQKEWDKKKSVVLYELEIKRESNRNHILVLADGMPEAVDSYEKGIITNGFSIKYRSLDKYGKIYPVSRARKAKKPQDDINHYLTTVFEHVDRAQRKIAYFEEGLTEQGKTSMRSADVYALVPKTIPGAVFEAAPAPSVVPENKEVIQLMTESINKHIGTSELQKSGKSDNDLATQDMLENQAFQSNQGMLQDTLGDLAKDLLDTLKDIQMQVWDGDDYFKVTGIAGGDAWYTPEMGPLSELLVGDVLIDVDIVSAQKPNPMKGREDALALANWITSPPIQEYLMIRGKKTNLSPIENTIKAFGQNPDVMIENLNPEPIPSAPGMPGMPGTIPVPMSPASPPPAAGPVPAQAAPIGGVA